MHFMCSSELTAEEGCCFPKFECYEPKLEENMGFQTLPFFLHLLSVQEAPFF